METRNDKEQEETTGPWMFLRRKDGICMALFGLGGLIMAYDWHDSTWKLRCTHYPLPTKQHLPWLWTRGTYLLLQRLCDHYSTLLPLAAPIHAPHTRLTYYYTTIHITLLQTLLQHDSNRLLFVSGVSLRLAGLASYLPHYYF
jgi:hypothetical protein